MVNWTQGNTLRRGDITVGVAYGSDLVKVKELLNGILSTHDKILKFTTCGTHHGFWQQLDELPDFFWLGHTRDLGMAKSDVINAIHLAFKKMALKYHSLNKTCIFARCLRRSSGGGWS